MPTCLVHPRGLPFSNSVHTASFLVFARRNSHAIVTRRTRRYASAAVAVKKAPESVPTQVADGRHTLTVLHKTGSLLPRILPSGSNGRPYTDALEFWNDLLRRAYGDLCPSPKEVEDGRVRIAVYGCDGLSGARELVTALLQDPFSLEFEKERLRRRWDAAAEECKGITMRPDASVSEESDCLHLQSAWFQQFGLPVEVLEFNTSSTPSEPTQEALKNLLHSDIPIIVCNPASQPLSNVLSSASPLSLPFEHHNAVLVISSASSSQGLAEHVQAQSSHRLDTLFVDPRRALVALDTLSTAPSSPLAVQRYQDGFVGSNISALTQVIRDMLLSRSTPAAAPLALRTQTAQSLIRGSLSACDRTLVRAADEADAVATATSSMRCDMEQARARVGLEVFGAAQPESGDEIQKAAANSRRDIKQVLDALVWWKLPWKVDDVREIVSAAVDGAWCKDLEHKLVFHAGHLAALQRSFTASASALVAGPPPHSPFCSPVLRNALAQLAAAPTYSLSASALTQPLHARRQQLRFPTARLHATAQRAVLTMGGSVFGGLGVAWAGWAGQLGVFDVGMHAETALGVGMFGAVAGIRWAVGRFERAKRRWWQDLDRVGEGLERDLRTTLDRTMVDRVVAVPERACSGLEELVARRRDEIAELRDEVAVLKDELAQS